ncbi:MAG: ubiquitin-like small modifier protein 1 [Halococcoides sp.]
MRWTLFASLAEAAGERTSEVHLDDDPTLREAFDALLATHPALEDRVLDAEGDLREYIHLFHNDEDPFQTADGWATPVEDTDDLVLFPPMSGG